MAKTYQDYFDTLGFRESSSISGGAQHYNIENSAGFIGKYQFGEAALFDLGYYGIDGSDSHLFKNDWTGNWSGKGGINSKQDYLNMGSVQETIIQDWHEILWARIQLLGIDKYQGQILNGHQITISGMLAASHLIGAGSWTIKHNNGGSDGTDTLSHIERINFSDTSLALDLDTNAGITAKTLGAVFGKESVSNKSFAGIGLSLLDAGMSYEALMQLAINAALGTNAANHTAVVDLLYENVIGFAPTIADEAYFVGLLDSGVHSVASIGIMAADTPLNEENIDLVGLSQTGLEYLFVTV